MLLIDGRAFVSVSILLPSSHFLFPFYLCLRDFLLHHWLVADFLVSWLIAYDSVRALIHFLLFFVDTVL